MMILTEKNERLDTDKIRKKCYYSVLRFKDNKNPDFYFAKMSQIEEFSAASIMLEIDEHRLVMPLNWSVLCVDHENIHAIPLYEVANRNYTVFGINPIDGFTPKVMQLQSREIYANAVWTSPPLDDKDMLVVPLGSTTQRRGGVERGPICGIFTPNRLDVSRPISDIW